MLNKDDYFIQEIVTFLARLDTTFKITVLFFLEDNNNFFSFLISN